MNPFAPSINSLFAESAASSGMLLSSGFWLAFILVSVIPCKKKRRKKAVKPADDAEPEADFDGEPPVTMARLMEHTDGYDNRLEEDYQNGWDKNDPSWQCGCGKWNTGNFIDMVQLYLTNLQDLSPSYGSGESGWHRVCGFSFQSMLHLD